MITHKTYNHTIPDWLREHIYEENINHPGKVILKTCRRVEVYEGKGNVEEETLLHLFRLVSGLESPLPGDTSVQWQVKTAYEIACQNKDFDKYMHRLFQEALRTGKLVRTNTSICKGAVSYAQASIQLLSNSLLLHPGSHVVVVGVNKLTADILKYLKDSDIQNITLVNRTFEKAVALATHYQVHAVSLNESVEIFKNADIIISAASVPHSIIGSNHINSNKNQTIIDLGVPANVHLNVKQLPNIKYFSLDDIENSVSANIATRKEEIEKAMGIIHKAVKNFIVWQKKQNKIFLDNKVAMVSEESLVA